MSRPRNRVLGLVNLQSEERWLALDSLPAYQQQHGVSTRIAATRPLAQTKILARTPRCTPHWLLSASVAWHHGIG
jgi:hypothetical protein